MLLDISTKVILREIDPLEQAMVTPRKSSERNNEYSLENSSAEPILTIESNNLVDMTNISLPSCFTNSVVNALDEEVLPIIDISDPFMNFYFIKEKNSILMKMKNITRTSRLDLTTSIQMR